MLFIHTIALYCTIKEILVSYEKSEKGDEIVEKQKPQFARSFAKIICRIQTCLPIAIEKWENLPPLGRFSLRDEGQIIAVGKVMKYMPAKNTG
jgi:peptide chain release factor subunit 3